jgi:hypothetical protein
MKAETKAKRRVTLSICGLGLLDETEVETVPKPVMDVSTGEELPPPAPEGFSAWFAALEGIADEGTTSLRRAWDAAPKWYHAHLTKYESAAWEDLKKRAALAGAK